MKKSWILMVLISCLSFPLFVAAQSNTVPLPTSIKEKTIETINLNTADERDLVRLKGVGEKKAQAIIQWREANGGFKTVEDLLKVKGIGEAIFRDIKEDVHI